MNVSVWKTVFRTCCSRIVVVIRRVAIFSRLVFPLVSSVALAILSDYLVCPQISPVSLLQKYLNLEVIATESLFAPINLLSTPIKPTYQKSRQIDVGVYVTT